MTVSAHRELVTRLAAAQKSSRGAAGYSRWVNRRLGRHVAAAAFRIGSTPNQVSAISALFTFTGIALIASVRTSWQQSLTVTLLLLVGYAFDSADGQLARLRGGGSYEGEWLDHVLDAAKVSTIHLAIAICWFRFYSLQSSSLLLIPLAFTAMSVVFFFALLLADFLRRLHDARRGATAPARNLDPNEPAPWLRSVLVLPADYGVLCIAIVALPARGVFEVVYALLLAANTVFTVGACPRWFRELRRLA